MVVRTESLRIPNRHDTGSTSPRSVGEVALIRELHTVRCKLSLTVAQQIVVVNLSVSFVSLSLAPAVVHRWWVFVVCLSDQSETKAEIKCAVIIEQPLVGRRYRLLLCRRRVAINKVRLKRIERVAEIVGQTA